MVPARAPACHILLSVGDLVWEAMGDVWDGVLCDASEGVENVRAGSGYRATQSMARTFGADARLAKMAVGESENRERSVQWQSQLRMVCDLIGEKFSGHFFSCRRELGAARESTAGAKLHVDAARLRARAW